jgi:hypothetical protein
VNGPPIGPDLLASATQIEADKGGGDTPPLAPDPQHSQRTLETCRQCGSTFAPRRGGKRQAYCSPACRRAFHDGPPTAERSSKQRGQRGANAPSLHVPESVLKQVDRIGREIRAEERDQDEPEFDWFNDQAIILREQRQVAIYRNRMDGLVMRQERDWHEDEDVFIVIAPENVRRFVDRLTEAARLEDGGGGDDEV